MPSSARKKSPSGSATSPAGASLSLREIVQQHLLQDVFEASNAAVQEAQRRRQRHQERNGAVTSSWMVLVVDPDALRVISSSIGMYNLMEHHVSIVEDLMKKRAPFRDQAVLYFIEPNERSIAKIVEDWTPARNRKGPMYGDTVFLYFLGRLSDELFGMIKGCKELVKRVKVLKEVNLDFLTKEAGAFHFDMGKPVGEEKKPSPLYSELYFEEGSVTPLQERMISKLVTVCATLNEYPHVRYPAKNELCKKLSFLFQQKMNEFVGSNATWWYNGDGTHPNTERSTLLLLDRRDDCLSPLMHEFTYEAMVHDLLPMDDDKITYQNMHVEASNDLSDETTKEKYALLNDNDEVWVELRGQHIAEVIQSLSSRIREIVNSKTGSALNASAKGKDGKALTVNQMAKALKALPEYKEIMSKLSQHMQIAHQCMDAFNGQGLLDLSDLEQTLATGKTDEGRAPKLKELLGGVVEQFRAQDDAGARLRLLAIAVVSQRGLSSRGDLDKLLAEANLSQGEMAALTGLERMGCPLVHPSGKGNKRVVAYHSAGTESDSEYSSSRYSTLLKSVMEDAASGALSMEEYPSVMPPPDPESMPGPSSSANAKSVRKSTGTTSKWAKTSSGGGGKKKYAGGRQIVFVAGGMCYSELRAAREVARSMGTEVVAGSNRYISPADFIGDLAGLA